MNSSTSSSEIHQGQAAPAAAGNPFLGDWKVLLSVACMLLAAEVMLRLYERHLSIDIAHIRSAEQMAKNMAQDAASRHEKVLLFLGNSLVRAGIDPSQLEHGFDAQTHGATKAAAYFFYPDGGNINAWRWCWRRYFLPWNAHPDLVLICGGASHFDDLPLLATDAAAYHVSAQDVPHVLRHEIHNSEDRLVFLAAKVSLAYANRQRIQRRLLDMIMPYNRTVLFDMSMNLPATGSRRAGTPGDEKTSRALGALLEDLRGSGIRTVVVAMPSYVKYDVPQSRLKVIESCGAHFIDLRTVEGIGKEHFYDKAHLNADGARMLTLELVRQLQKLQLP